MIGFELYQVSAWVENGFTKHLDQKERKKAPLTRKSPWKGAIAAAFIASAAAVAADASIDVSHTLANLQLPASRNVGDTIISADDVPTGYWPKLMQEMRSWENLEENALEPPDPIV